MGDDLRERLLASYADLGEALVIQNVLETEGIPCRVGDLANLPAHVLGIAGGMRRAVGLWVLESDAERATALLAELGAPDAVDEEALAVEALAAGPAARADAARTVAGAHHAAARRSGRPGWLVAVLAAGAIALAAFLLAR